MQSFSEDARAGTSGDDRPLAIPPPDDLAATVVVPDDVALREHAEREGPQFWAAIAHELQWESNPRETVVGTGASAHWFGDGAGNLTINCLDRHLHESRRDKAALLWRGAGGEERRYTYAELHRLVCKFASGLKELGVGAGAFVTLALPPSPEGVAALLACARLGAIAVPSDGAVASPRDTGPGWLIITDAALTGEAEAGSASVPRPNGDPARPRTIIWQRANGGARVARGAIALADLLKGASPRCEPLVVAGDAPFFALPADAAEGTAGPQFAHGGFAVGVSFTTRIAYDLKDETIYCPLGPGGWLAARPALILGPLLNGATIVLHETPPPAEIVWADLARDGVTTVVAPTTLLRDLAAASVQAGEDVQLPRLVIGDGPPLSTDDWWTIYRTILHERAHLCANWWEPPLGGPVIGTLPSMAAHPGLLGKSLPGVTATIAGAESAGDGPLRLVGSWPHLAHGVDPATIAPGARRDEEGEISLAAND